MQNRRINFGGLLALAFTLVLACGTEGEPSDPSGAVGPFGIGGGKSDAAATTPVASDAGAFAIDCVLPLALYRCADGSTASGVAHRDGQGRCATKPPACMDGGGDASGAGGSGGAGGSSGATGGSGGSAASGLDVGERCGGKLLAPRACRSGLTCMKAPGRCSTPPDDSGLCEEKPTACTKEFVPVCGCDGVTYGNDCQRRAAGIPLDHAESCSTKKPGKLGDTCGGIAALTCADGLFCEPPANACRVADGSGVCQARPEACTTIYAPVCGCDGKTYGSDCQRRGAGVGKDHDGECAPTGALLKAGLWGATGAVLTVKDPAAGGVIELDCAHGTIDGPLAVRADGSFKWSGHYVREGGPATLVAPGVPQPLPPATFSGRAVGGKLELVIDGGAGVVSKHLLQLGATGTLRKCL